MFDFKQRGSQQASAGPLQSYIKKLNLGQHRPNPHQAAQNPNVPSRRQASAPGQRGPSIGGPQATAPGQRGGSIGGQMPSRKRDVFPALDPIFMWLFSRMFGGRR